MAPADRPRSFRRMAKSWGLPWTEVEASARDNFWKDRALAWDAHLDRVRVDAAEAYAEETGRDVARRHLRPLQKALALAERELDKFLDASAGCEMPGLLTPRDVIRILVQGVKVERLIRGDTTEKVAVEEGPDLSALSVDELRALRDLQAKAGEK